MIKRALEGINTFLQRQPEASRLAFVQANHLVSCDAAEQYWGQPYDERYLVLSFPGFDFKLTDLLMLSRSAVVDESGTDDVIDFVEARRLRHGTWLTTCALSSIQEDVYLHFYFVGSESKLQHTSRKISLKDLPVRPGPEMRDGVVVKPHPRVPPAEIPALSSIPEAGPAAHARLTPALVSGAASLPFNRLFLSFDGWTYPQLNCYSVAGQVESWDYLALAEQDPSSPTDHGKHDYCYVSDLDDGVYYNFMTWAMTRGAKGWRHQKWHNANFWTLDLDSAAKMRMWYVRWQNGQWVRLGEVAGFQPSFSNWMRDIRASIGNKKLHEIAIPGTHDSGCFDLYEKAATAEFSQSQNLDFPGQLQYGVRYFDLRLYLADDGSYYFNHASTKTYTRINDFVSALEAFMGQPGNAEIVIADFSRFGQAVGSDFSQSDYRKILELFTGSTVLGPLLANGAPTTATVDQLMTGNKRLVLLCDKSSEPWFQTITSRLNITVLPSINKHSEWANTASMTTLESKLQAQVTRHAGFGQLWALQAQLTPTPVFDTMQNAATRCNAVAAKWVNDRWWNSVNVVFCDFITGGGLVEVLIDCNKRRP